MLPLKTIFWPNLGDGCCDKGFWIFPVLAHKCLRLSDTDFSLGPETKDGKFGQFRFFTDYEEARTKFCVVDWLCRPRKYKKM